MIPPAAPARRRLLTGVVGLVLALFLFGLAGPAAPSLRAQDDAADTAAKPTTSAADDPGEKKGMIRHMIESVGWVFGPMLLFISVALIAIIVLLAMDLRMSAAIPPGFVEDFSDLVNKRQFKAAYELARDDGSFLGRVMTTGMGRLQYGIEDAREAAFNMVDSIKSSKEQLISYLATIGTLGPLLGLVGTVYGMIEAFLVLATGTQIDAKALADKISHALVVTLFGVALSVPAIFCHTLFRNRLIRLSMDTGNVADDLLTQMYHNSKKPAATAAPAAEAVPADNRAAAAAAVKQK
jgi:biopolymer transport protein ExbB